MPKTLNSEVLEDFIRFCRANPDLRFWQALRAWSGYYRIFATNSINVSADENLRDRLGLENTFSWEGKDK